MLIFNIFILLDALYLFPPYELFIFFTNWGLMFTISSLILTIKCARDIDISKKPTIMAWNHLTFEFAFFCEIIITVIYWTVIHEEVIK